MIFVILILCILLLFCIYLLLNEHKKLLIYAEKCRKQEVVLNFYSWWKYKSNRSYSISKTLKEQGFRTVAIYGLGRLGKNVIDEIKSKEIEVSFCVDQGYGKPTYEGIDCFSADSKLPEVDVLIITVISSSAEEIRKKISKLNPHIQMIKTIQEVLYESI